MTSRRVERLLDALVTRRLTVAVAESLTGGLVLSTLVDAPGASRALRGGVVAYATDVKASLLDVDRALLDAQGAVDPLVARQMAQGAARRLGADLGLATTGVAGPDPQDGFAPGTVFVAAALGRHVRSLDLTLGGDRSQIREQARDAVLDLALVLVDEVGVPLPPGTTVHGRALGECDGKQDAE